MNIDLSIVLPTCNRAALLEKCIAAITNNTRCAHELVVVRTDLPADGLPTNEDGSFDEDGEGVEVVGELEEIEPGTSGTLTVDLEPGHYVFLCNVVQDEGGEPFSHYQQGMRVDVEVDAAAASAAPGASLAPMTSPAPMPRPAAAASPMASTAPA